MSDKKANIKALRDFRLNGEAVVKGQVVSKKDFPNKSDWQNICHMTPARAEETSDAVGKPKAEGAKSAAKKGKMPGT